MRRARRTGALRRAAAAAAACLAAAGCRSADPAGFAAYREALEAVQESSEALFRRDVEWSRAGAVDRFAEEGRAFADLKLDLAPLPAGDPACPEQEAPPPARGELREPGTGADWPEDVAFAEIERAGRALGALNETMALYASLLAELAGPGELSARRFDALARQLDTRAGGLAASFAELGVALPPETSGAVGLLSLGSAEGLRLYFAQRRQRELRAALARNQPLVAAWACAARQALAGIGDDLTFEYSERFRSLAREHAEARGAAQRHALVARAFELDAAAIASLAALRELWEVYGALPAAHAALARSLDARDAAPEALQALATLAGRLRQRHGELRQD